MPRLGGVDCRGSSVPADVGTAMHYLALQLERTNRLLEALAPRYWSLDEVCRRNPTVPRATLIELLRERGIYRGQRGRAAAIPVEDVLRLEREIHGGGGS